MKCKVSLLALLFKISSKSKINKYPSTYPGLQVSRKSNVKKFQKAVKSILHFPYDLMRLLYTFEKLLSFSINLFACQLYLPPNSHFGYSSPLISDKALRHFPSAKGYDLTQGCQVCTCHTALRSPTKMGANTQV